VLTEDRHGIVQGLPHDLAADIFLRTTPLTRPARRSERSPSLRRQGRRRSTAATGSSPDS
jgi:hypothetical protein